MHMVLRRKAGHFKNIMVLMGLMATVALGCVDWPPFLPAPPLCIRRIRTLHSIARAGFLAVCLPVSLSLSLSLSLTTPYGSMQDVCAAAV